MAPLWSGKPDRQIRAAWDAFYMPAWGPEYEARIERLRDAAADPAYGRALVRQALLSDPCVWDTRAWTIVRDAAVPTSVRELREWLGLAATVPTGYPEGLAQRFSVTLRAVENFLVAGGSVADIASDVNRVLRALDDTMRAGAPTLARQRLALAQIVNAGITKSISAADNWGPDALRILARTPAAADVALTYAATIGDGPKPTAKWCKGAAPIVSEPATVAVTVELVEAAARADAVPGVGAMGVTDLVYLTGLNEHIVRGLVWLAALAADHDERALGVVGDVAIRAATKTRNGPLSPKLANTAIAALGSVATPAAVAELARVESKIKHKSLRSRVNKALDTAAEKAGVTRAELRELSVPKLGFDNAGELVVAAGADGHARLRIADLDVTVVWVREDGKEQKTVPAAIKQSAPDVVTEVKAIVKDARRALALERERVESLLAGEAAWRAADWRERYLDHPITSAVARNLLWSVEPSGGNAFVALPERDGHAVTTLDGKQHALTDDATVRLWHPVDADAPTIAAWRDRLTQADRYQPFKQAFREIYLLTPAEEATEIYSNRFAAHVVRAGPLSGVVRARGWSMGVLGGWDGGYESTATREYDAAPYFAGFEVIAVDSGMNDMGLFELASTDRVWINQTAAHAEGARRHIPLAEVPRRAFSEIMRDVDLFVAVASIGNDPTWADRGVYVDYWTEYSFGDLAETAKVRRDVLATLIPRLAIADRLTLEERFLRVRGDITTYRIHLGSANIQMEPDNRYLCIVPGRDPKQTRIMIPFAGDDDRTLAVIISKALMLAADSKITDESIIRQIQRQ